MDLTKSHKQLLSARMRASSDARKCLRCLRANALVFKTPSGQPRTTPRCRYCGEEPAALVTGTWECSAADVPEQMREAGAVMLRRAGLGQSVALLFATKQDFREALAAMNAWARNHVPGKEA